MTEKELIGKFILTTFKPGSILAPEHIAQIEAAQARLYKQLTALAGNGKRGGRPRDKKPSTAALAKRRERERKQGAAK